MKKAFAGPTVLILTAATLTAAVPVTINMDENGNGTWNGVPLFPAGGLANDTGPGGLANALTYYFGNATPPFGGAIDITTPGDLFIYEQPGGALSELIRFRTGNVLFNAPASLVFYSDRSDGADSLADIGFPTANNANTFSVVETGVEGGPRSFYYLPLPGQPGYTDDPANTGHSYVAYNIISEVPEPATGSLMAAFLLAAFGSRVWQRMNKPVA